MKRRRRVAPSGRLLSTLLGSGFRGCDSVGSALVSALRVVVPRLEELLTERGVAVDHVTPHRWVQRFTPLLIDAASPGRHAVGSKRFVDQTYVKVVGVWRYVYRAVDGYGQVIDVFVSSRRDIAAARTFLTTAIAAHGEPEEVVTDRSAALANVIDELVPQALHNIEKYANNRVECDHGRLKARLRPMRGLKTDRTATVVIAGHAFILSAASREAAGVEIPNSTAATAHRTTPRRITPGPRHSTMRSRPSSLAGRPGRGGIPTHRAAVSSPQPHAQDLVRANRPCG